MPRKAPIIAGIVAALLLMFGAYMGSYYALLQGKQFWQYDEGDGRGYVYRPRPVYRIKSGVLEASLEPSHQFDRLIRPSYWAESQPTGLFTD